MSIIVSGVVFHAHRVLLAAWSPQLRELLLRSPTQVQLGGIDADAFELVLDFLYDPRHLKMSMQIVGPVLNVSQRLGIAVVKQECATFLLRQLSTQNCKHLHALANTYGIAELKRKAEILLDEHPNYSEQLTPTEVLQQVARDCRLSRYPQLSVSQSTPSAQDVVEHWARRLNSIGATKQEDVWSNKDISKGVL